MLFTLLLTTAILFIRPSELYPPLAEVPIYEMAIISCIITSFHTILPQFEPRAIALTPLTTTFLLYIVMQALGHAANGQFGEIIDSLTEFAKMLVYFSLLVGILTTKERLFIYIRAVVILGAVAAFIAFLNLWRVIHIEGQENVYTGEEERMGATGLFKDPNDMASLMAVFVIFGLFLATKKNTKILERAFWLGLVGLFFAAIQASLSRGGLAAAGGGLFGWCLARFGKKGLLIVPVMLVGVTLIGGRQSDMSLSSGTGQRRIQLQHAGLAAFIAKPFFGIGPKHYQIDVDDHVAHNSFLQAYTETGFPGGALFASAYALALMMLIKLSPKTRPFNDPQLAEIQPCLIGVLACEMVGKMSLTHNWLLTTYLTWGLVTAYTRICLDEFPIDRWSKYPLMTWYFVVGVIGVFFFYFYLNAMVRFG